MPRGTVRFWDESRGFGFIEQDDGVEIFAHVRQLVIHRESVPVGTPVEFEIAINERNQKPEARNVVILEGLK